MLKAMTRTMATVAMAFGALIDQVLKPKSLTKIAEAQYEPGILSRLIVPAGSIAPKKKFERFLLMLIAIEA